MQRRFIAAAAAAALLFLIPSQSQAVLGDPPQASTTDVWDISQGATAHTSLSGTTFGAVTNAFGGSVPIGGDPYDEFIFGETTGLQSMEWQTASTSIRNIGVYLQHDGSDVNNRRALNFRILAKVNAGDLFTTILGPMTLSANSAGSQYSGGQFGGATQFYSFLPVDTVLPNAKFFRAEFSPFSGNFPGVRVRELDGYVPEPASLAVIGLSAAGLLSRSCRRRRIA